MTITPEQLDAFRRTLQQEERSPGTIDNYLRHVHAFAAWLSGRAISKMLVLEWRDTLQYRGYAAITINTMLAALHSYFRFAGVQDCRVKYLRVQRKLFRSKERELTLWEYRKLIATARSSGQNVLALMMETLCATGMRVSELAYITAETVQQGRTDISLKGKIRTIVLSEKLRRRLLNYMRAHKITHGSLFLTVGDAKVSRHTIWAKMKRLAKIAGVLSSKVFPHNLRHLFAQRYYQQTHDIARLADLLGHSSIETTRIYLAVSDSDCAKELDQLGLVCE
ncbi:MAG: tyrosine-type recombinase/integrase [Peptococcaceae bacterium]|nr:tyrosine-type recombinase/integrase [Peptococcaceae bacterium]